MAKDEFQAEQAVLEDVPLLLGLEGPPGGGKTFSSLRLARGMQRVRPGQPIIVIDTEGGRSRKYADQFAFKIVELRPPFRALRFLAALEAQLREKPSVIVIDSLTDEHEGTGGLLEFQEEEIQRLAGDNEARQLSQNQRSWIKPKAGRKKLVNFLQHFKACPVIMTFRAREKTVQKKVDGKTVFENLGFVPIAPNDILFALDLVCLLPPRADGVPRWRSEKLSEEEVTKLPDYLKPFIDIERAKPLDEELGEALARWAKGGKKVEPPQQPAETVDKAQEGARRSKQELFNRAREKCRGGRKVYFPWRDRLTPQQLAFLAEISEELVEILDASDAQPEPAQAGPEQRRIP
jgi:hypothetical protein